MRPIPVFHRIKNIRTWIKESDLFIETYLEDAVHFIILSLTIDIHHSSIKAIHVNYLRCPYPDLCVQTKDNYQKLIGLKIEPGFNKKVRQLVPSIEGCVHIFALLKEAGDAVMQTHFYMTAKNTSGAERRKLLFPKLRNICFVYSDAMNKPDNQETK